ncbi:PHP domain-containing protein [Thermobrachium celere]|uniref:COG0613, Predicted metal-dependent phosphoesterases (PHP family) n=1 Tax=Thermobrachium celere DSM 8682 TaxID=941824 RepID=R7RRF7_9CLOT|nr:PHP domain-containing protein [Thermobrachium celere]CDF58624.1 COG0613, Predicted metal-dependent phosphoesterases (PHP family) [Thermobrachium celere DSM 8682]
MLNKGDFHIHSNASDGKYSPTEIVILSKINKIDVISITDHNTTAGIEEAIEAGRNYGVSVVPAIELSTRFNNESIHLLGYFKNSLYQIDTFQEVLMLIKSHRYKTIRKILGNYINLERKDGKLSVIEGINLLRCFGASVVLAHPMRISSKNINQILRFPFDGIEAKYSYTDFNTSLYFINIALTKFSFYTAGSDFHSIKNKNSKHSFIGSVYLNNSEIEFFLKNSGYVALNYL